MGIDFTGLRALAFSKRVYGFDFRETVMLGRQEIHFWKEEYMAVRKNAKLDFEYDEAIELGQFAEPLFRKIGAQNVTSVDAAGYEGASVIHDFNLPLPENLFGAFDTFVDFGSIEHVFNVAQAIHNVSSIVKVHGSILIVTIANGFSGHGFYQYSPSSFIASSANAMASAIPAYFSSTPLVRRHGISSRTPPASSVGTKYLLASSSG